MKLLFLLPLIIYTLCIPECIHAQETERKNYFLVGLEPSLNIYSTEVSSVPSYQVYRPTLLLGGSPVKGIELAGRAGYLFGYSDDVAISSSFGFGADVKCLVSDYFRPKDSWAKERLEYFTTIKISFDRYAIGQFGIPRSLKNGYAKDFRFGGGFGIGFSRKFWVRVAIQHHVNEMNWVRSNMLFSGSAIFKL